MLHHATRSPLASVALATLALIGLGACADPATAPRPAESLAPRASVATLAFAPLYASGPTTAATYGCFAPDAAECADEFTVPAGQTWTLTHLRLVMSTPHFVPISTVTLPTLRVIADASGAPSALTIYSATDVAWERITPVAVPAPVPFFAVTFALPTPVVLRSGTYWLAHSSSDGVRTSLAVATGSVIHHRTVGAQDFVPLNETAMRLDLDMALLGTAGVAPTDAHAIAALRVTVQGYALPQGTAQSLDSKLWAALAAFDAGNTAGACTALQDALNFVAAQRGKKISVVQSDELSAALAAIRTSLGC